MCLTPLRFRRFFKETVKNFSVLFARAIKVEKDNHSRAVFGTEEHNGRNAGISAAVAPSEVAVTKLVREPAQPPSEVLIREHALDRLFLQDLESRQL